MGCVICNIFAGCFPPLGKYADDEQYLKELKEEMCNDIAIGHPEMVARINEICKASASLKRTQESVCVPRSQSTEYQNTEEK